MQTDNFNLNHRERPTFVATAFTGVLLKGSPEEGDFDLAVAFKPSARPEWFAAARIMINDGPFEVARKLEALAVTIRDMHLANGRVR